jgi:hypothetical protein
MKFKLMKQFFALVGFAFLLTSCDTDIIDPPGLNDPSVSVSSTPSGDIAAGSVFTFNVNATPSTDNPLKAIEFTEDGNAIPFSRITIDGSSASSNPILLFGDDKNGISWQVSIEAHADASVKEYGVLVTDDANNTDSDEFDVSTSVLSPTVSIAGDFTAEFDPGVTLRLETTLEKGTYDIASIAVYQGEDLITDLDRLAYKELANKFTSNPYNVLADEVDGGMLDIFLAIQDNEGTVPYRMVVTDVEGNSSDFNFEITTIVNVAEIQGVLFNAGGPQGTGGLDLDNGEGTGSADADAEIRDEGIDLDQPAETNWIQRISGVNGSEIKYLIPGENGLSETFTYEDVVSQQALAELFDNGVDFTATNDDGDKISNVVQVGDVFTVRNGEKTYLVIVREVNIIPTSMQTNSNGDNYVVDIKQ